jgi:hydrogenase maturation protease
MKTIVIGLGNPIVSDDGVGIRIAETLESRLNPKEAAVISASLAGLDLLDMMVGYDRAIVIDAIQTLQGKPGDIYRLDADALKTTRHTSSTHDVNLATALELGKRLGLELPRQIDVIAIEVADVTTFSEELTPEVAQAVSLCVEMVVADLKRNGAVKSSGAAHTQNLPG